MKELTEGRKNTAMILAILPSFVGLIGIGHIYVGRIGMGIGFMFAGFIGLVVAVIGPWFSVSLGGVTGNLGAGLGMAIVFLLMYTIIAIISIVHLYKSTKKQLASGSDDYYNPRSPPPARHASTPTQISNVFLKVECL